MEFIENFYDAEKSVYESYKSTGQLEGNSLYFVTDSETGTQFVARGGDKVAGSFIIENEIPSSPIKGVLYYIKSYGSSKSPFVGHYNGSKWESIFEFSDYITNRYLQSDGTIVYSERFNDKRNTSIGSGSHAEGISVTAGGVLSNGSISYSAHAEGYNTHAIAPASHAEGYGSSVDEGAMGSHAEGYATTAYGMYSHAEGLGADSRHSIPSVRKYEGAKGMASHVEGGGVNSNYMVMGNNAYGMGSHAEGMLTTSTGDGSHAEGYDTSAIGFSSHSEGEETYAFGEASHAEGAGHRDVKRVFPSDGREYNSGAVGNFSHCEGGNIQIITLEDGSKVKGYMTNSAIGTGSHAEGGNTWSFGEFSHSQGEATASIGKGSHAEGYNTQALGDFSHSEGMLTLAKSNYSHAEGINNHSTKNTIHSVGVGNETFSKSAHEIMLNGDHFIYGIGGYDGTNSEEDGVLSLQSVINKEYKKFVVVGIWGQSNAVGYDEGVVNKFDVQKYTNRVYQVSAISDAIQPLTYCAENLQNMNTVIPKGYTNDRESTPKPDQGTKGIHLPLANLICDAIPDDYGVIIVPYAYGGKSITYFLDDERVNGFTNNIKYALDFNDDNVFGGIVWCQGESDTSNMNKDVYKENFTNLVNKVNNKLQSYVGRTSGNRIDASVWYFYEYPTLYRKTTYGYDIMDAIKEVVGESNYVSVPENHPVNITRYSSSNKDAHYAGDYFRTYIAPSVFNCMNNNGAFFTNDKSLSQDSVTNMLTKEMNMQYCTDKYQIVNEGDYIRYGTDSFKIVDGAVTLSTANTGMFEFEGDTFEAHIDSATNGMMFFVGKTIDNKVLELYLGPQTGYKPLFQKSSPTSTSWSNVLNLNSGISSNNGQIVYNPVNAWSKVAIINSTIKLVKSSKNNSVSVYKDNTLIGTIHLSDICNDLVATIGLGAYWSNSGNVQLTNIKAYHIAKENVKEVVSDLIQRNKYFTDALKNIMDSIGQPIILSPSNDNVLRWYNLSIRPDQNSYIHTNLDNSNVSYYNQVIENDDRFCWAFVGNFVDGFKIYNKKFQTLAITISGGANTLVTMTENGSLFKLYPSSNNNYPYPYFAIGSNFNGTQLYLNKLSEGIGLWTSSDIGSTFKSFPCA